MQKSSPIHCSSLLFINQLITNLSHLSSFFKPKHRTRFIHLSHFKYVRIVIMLILLLSDYVFNYLRSYLYQVMGLVFQF